MHTEHHIVQGLILSFQIFSFPIPHHTSPYPDITSPIINPYHHMKHKTYIAFVFHIENAINEVLSPFVVQ